MVWRYSHRASHVEDDIQFLVVAEHQAALESKSVQSHIIQDGETFT